MAQPKPDTQLAPEIEFEERFRWLVKMREHLERMLALEVSLIVAGVFGVKLAGEPWQLLLALAAFCFALLGNWIAITAALSLERSRQKVEFGRKAFEAMVSEWEGKERSYWDLGLVVHVRASMVGMLLLALYGLQVVFAGLFGW